VSEPVLKREATVESIGRLMGGVQPRPCRRRWRLPSDVWEPSLSLCAYSRLGSQAREINRTRSCAEFARIFDEMKVSVLRS
jgi:hypothetical protein